MRTPEQALAWCKQEAEHPSRSWLDDCLMFARSAYNIPSKYATASIAWSHTTQRGTGTPPRGALVWWTGGSHGAGHVAVSIGDGTCWTSDFGNDAYLGDGKIHRERISNIAQHASFTYRGWSRDINDVLAVPEEEEDMALSEEDKKWITDTMVGVARNVVLTMLDGRDTTFFPASFYPKERAAYSLKAVKDEIARQP